MEDLLRIFKALADETRLRILYLLTEREACVGEIKLAMRISQTRASRNLGILHDAGLLKSRREGPLMFYSIDSRALNKTCSGLDGMITQAFEFDRVAQVHRERLKRPLERSTGKISEF
jgi:ArsR family transcriptional regulator, arsenate/arsenite/antimonite-responsive transcriptional repressor